MKIINQKHEQVAVERLTPHPRNPNVGNLEAIQASIDENGFFGAIIAQKSTGHILVGHHRFQAAVQAGAAKVPVFWVDVDDTRALKILLADNKTAELASRDDERLAEILRELAEGGEGLVGSGYDTSDLDLILARTSDELPDSFKALDEGIASTVKTVTCPGCGHEFPGMTYAETLAAAALDARAPRRPDAPTVISTFAGRGGSTGYHMAGFRELLAVEWDDHAVATLRLNYPDLDVWQGDIAQLGVPDVLARTGLKVGELDLFDGSPPCQGFSTSGRRAMDDPRNQLFREFTRLLRGLMPRAFVMENVTGLAKGKMKAVFAEILQELKGCGYQVTAGIVNAAYLGVPQARERVIFIGCRDDLGLTPTLPIPQTRFVTAGQALADLPDRADGPGQMTAQKWINVWARVKPGHDFASIHPKGNLFNYLKLSPDRPVGTITKTITSGNGGPGIYHWKHPRLLNINELTRLGSFPDTYLWPGDPATDAKDHQQVWAGIGNAVPPLMARAIAQHVRATLLSSNVHAGSTHLSQPSLPTS